MKIIFYFLYACVALTLAAETEEQQFASGSRLFDGALYNELLIDNNDNFLVSPFSAEIIMALTQSGAVGATAQEIRSSLHLPASEEETEALIKKVVPAIASDQSYTLGTANKVYVVEDLVIKDQFKKVATDVYQAEYQNIDFGKSASAAAEINDWVAQKTDNKIRNIVTPDDFDDSTRLVLINALHFQAIWNLPFPHSAKKAKFYTNSENAIDADIMAQPVAQLNYAESEELDAKFLELPFRGNKASMTIILPNKKEGIAILEKQINSVVSAPEYSKEFVAVQIPKFKIESKTNFKQLFEKMGVTRVFDPIQADLSGLAGTKGELFIGNIFQKTYIDVNELGVEADAATVVTVATDAVLTKPKQTFVADHPFLFYIKVEDVIIFEGRVLTPNY